MEVASEIRQVLAYNDMPVKDETPIRYAHAEIQTQVVVICGPTCYQLDHGDTPCLSLISPTYYIYIYIYI